MRQAQETDCGGVDQVSCRNWLQPRPTGTLWDEAPDQLRLVSLQNDSMLCSDPDSRRLGRGRVEHPGSGRLLQRCAHAHEDPWPPGCAGMLSGTQQECSPFEGLGLSTARHSRARHGTARHRTRPFQSLEPVM